MPKIENARHILDIIAPIPTERFIINMFTNGKGDCCFIGHINKVSSPDANPEADYWGFGARDLTRDFLNEKHGINEDGASVNNSPIYNGYTEPVIKDRLMHLLNDMIEAGY